MRVFILTLLTVLSFSACAIPHNTKEQQSQNLTPIRIQITNGMMRRLSVEDRTVCSLRKTVMSDSIKNAQLGVKREAARGGLVALMISQEFEKLKIPFSELKMFSDILELAFDIHAKYPKIDADLVGDKLWMHCVYHKSAISA